MGMHMQALRSKGGKDGGVISEKNGANPMQILTQRHELPDKSPVFDVVMIKDGQRWNIPAVTERDADELRFKLIEAFRDHSNEAIKEW